MRAPTTDDTMQDESDELDFKDEPLFNLHIPRSRRDDTDDSLDDDISESEVSLHVTICQTKGVSTSHGNVKVIQQAITEASLEGIHLLVFPELFLSGYQVSTSEMHACAVKQEGDSIKQLKQICVDTGVAVVFGYAEKDAVGDRIYNSAMFINSDGTILSNYRKIHFKTTYQKDTFRESSELPSVSTFRGVKIGLLIGFDILFPELVRNLCISGAEFIIVVMSSTNVLTPVQKLVAPTRAIENGCIVALVNRAGHEMGYDWSGFSCISGPDGMDIIRCGSAEEFAIGVLELDSPKYQLARKINPCLKTRRPSLYGDCGAQPNTSDYFQQGPSSSSQHTESSSASMPSPYSSNLLFSSASQQMSSQLPSQMSSQLSSQMSPQTSPQMHSQMSPLLSSQISSQHSSPPQSSQISHLFSPEPSQTPSPPVHNSPSSTPNVTASASPSSSASSPIARIESPSNKRKNLNGSRDSDLEPTESKMRFS